MLIKSADDGLDWVTPLTDAQMQGYVQQAADAANLASSYSTNAGNSAVAASTAAGNAERINQKTMSFLNEKFW